MEILERRDCPAALMIEGGGEISEAGGTTTFSVRLSSPERQPVAVDFFLQGSAAGGQDFRLATGTTSLSMPRGTISFRPGETLKTITVRAIDDPAREGEESFALTLFRPRNARLGPQNVAVVSIRDDDAYTARVAGPTVVAEGTTNEYTLLLSSPATKTETFYVNTAPGLASTGTDFRPLSQLPLVFNPGEMSKRFRIQTLADDLVEYDEYFLLRITPSTQGFPAVAPFGVTIQGIGPMPPPSLTISDVTTTEGNAGLTAFVFTVRANTPFGEPITVNYATADGSASTADQDYVATSGTLTIDPGETTATIRVDVRGDTRFEPDEAFSLVLSSPVNATLDDATGIGTITNDDTNSATTFQITVRFPDNSLTLSQRTVFEQAAARWSQIITADLPDVPFSGRIIDDIEIEATAPAIDGPSGVLGQAGPTRLRSGGSRLPYQGIMEFDSADVGRMERDGTFNGVILHEMGHVLGIGSLWRDRSLVVNINTADPQYVGTSGLREYRTLANQPAAAGVPVENQGGAGTAGAHWRESVFRTELMTGYAERAGVAMPISRMTVGALEDLGYVVNYAAADSYSLPRSTSSQQMGVSSPLDGRQTLLFARHGDPVTSAVFALLGQTQYDESSTAQKRRGANQRFA